MKRHFRTEGIPKPGARVYSLIAAKSPLLKDLYKEVAEEVFSTISSGVILDIGTGPGYLPIELSKKSEGLQIIGIDISPEMVKIATRNAEKEVLTERVKFQIGSARSIPFANSYFDFVVSTASFHHWFEPVECLKEIYRVLKEDGEAWIYDLRRDMTKEATAQLRNKYGGFLSGPLLTIVKLHSSMTLKKVQAILSSSEIGFSCVNVEDKGLALKIRLSK